MKFFITSLILLSSLATLANGDPAKSSMSSVSGVVKEAGSDELLTGVRVSIIGTDIFTYTDRDGNFSLQGIPTGKVELAFSLVSFEKLALDLPVLESPGDLVVHLESR